MISGWLANPIEERFIFDKCLPVFSIISTLFDRQLPEAGFSA
jgi:hypothetical protein